MKYFIKRKSKIWNKAAFGSALLLVSAFAMFSTTEVYGAPKKEKYENVNDSSFTARAVFEKIQTPSLEILPISRRLDMLDYWDVDSVYKVSNALEGLSWLEKVTPSYLKVRITPVSTLEIKILIGKKSKFAMTIYTVGDDVQAQDSQVNFYDQDLNVLDTSKYLEMPQLKNFFEIPKGSATKMKEIEDMIPFPTICFSANPDNDNLSARLTVEKFVNEDDWNIAKLFLKPDVVLYWNNNKYKLKK